MHLRQLLLLGKPRISLPVTLSALTGFLLYSGAFAGAWIQTVLGVFLMSFASSAINQVQEAGIDRRMDRTRHRPIPTGRVKPYQAVLVAQFTGLAGFLLLVQPQSSGLPAILGVAALTCYNLIYTPLKKVTAFAVLPGALVGALPPLIGWTAAGGSLWHMHILLVGFFFFVGQIPHFWLIQLRHGPDYARAGLPVLDELFSRRQIQVLTLGWVAATAMAAILLPLFGVIRLPLAAATVYLATLWLLWSFRHWLVRPRNTDPERAFRAINFYYLSIMLVLVADALFF